MDDYSETPMSFLRAYVGICMGVSNEVAGKEFEQHLIKGGQFDKAFEVLKRKMEESDFFVLSNRMQKRKLLRFRNKQCRLHQ